MADPIVIVGAGQAGAALAAKLRALGYTGPLALEREAGDNRLGDIAKGVEAIKSNAPA